MRSFSPPPHRAPQAADCDLLPVFAWEFDTIPDESWGEDPGNNWAEVLAKLPGAISHSRYAVNAVQRSLGDRYPVVSIPAPVWDDFADLADTPWNGEIQTLNFRGTLLDSAVLGLDADPDFEPMTFETTEQTLCLDGVVFTSVGNPADGRKNWMDQLTAFVWTFRDVRDVTLVVKLVNHDRDRVCAALLLEMRKLAPFHCRVIVIHGYLDPAVYDQLILATTFTVNSSYGEGQCLPMMEFMSAGRPAVAPIHTAMAEYLNLEDALPVRCSLEWTFWPQDPRRRLRCMRYQIDWDSLCGSFSAAAQIARHDMGRYHQMAQQATNILKEHCSMKVVEQGLQQFFERLGYLRAIEESPPEGRGSQL